MKLATGGVGALLALASPGCVLWGGSSEEDPPLEERSITVIVDNGLFEPVVIRIDARRIGEADSVTRSRFSTDRFNIARRTVTVCAHGTQSSRTVCHPGRLNVPNSVREIWITISRSGNVRAEVL